jgi:2-amino-4-hydroxy-6-hydroxymethyldihydropteridine diphosphokinase
MLWHPAYVGVGSNLDRPAWQVRRALERLAGLPESHLLRQSSLYRSRPLGPVAQPDFVNAAAGILTRLEAPALFARLRELELSLGRSAPRERWGPRRIDLDLLVYGALRLEGGELTLPHPGIAARNFVLYPLAEVAPDLEVPGLGRVAALRERVDAGGIWRLDPEAPLS